MIEQVAGVLLAATLHQPTTTQTVATPYWLRVSRKYQDNRYERFRKCVVKRESEGIATVVNRHSNAQGLYQFLPKYFDKPLKTRLHLYGTRLGNKPIHLWPAAVQTAGFWWALHAYGPSPWAGGRWSCTRYLP